MENKNMNPTDLKEKGINQIETEISPFTATEIMHLTQSAVSLSFGSN